MEWKGKTYGGRDALAHLTSAVLWLLAASLVVACATSQIATRTTPAPTEALDLMLSETPLSGLERRIKADSLSIIGRLAEVMQDGVGPRLRFDVEEAERVVSVRIDWSGPELPLVDWLDRPVRLEMRRDETSRDLRVTDDESGRLLLLVAERRFPARFPSEVRAWEWPADLLLSRRTTRSQIRTLADEYDCFRLSFHYPLWLKDASPARSLAPGIWERLSWRGASYRLLNRDTWWIRRRSCSGGMGAGATFVAYLVDLAPETVSPEARSPETRSPETPNSEAARLGARVVSEAPALTGPASSPTLP